MGSKNKGFPEDQFSQIALGLAKWAANAKGSQELTPFHCILGFSLAAADTSTSVPPSYAPYVEEFQNILKWSQILESGETPQAPPKAMTIANELRVILNESKGDLEKLLFEIGAVARTYSKFSSEEFSEIISHATEFGKKNKLASIDEGSFCGGAYLAYLSGNLEKSPLLTAFISANLNPIQALITKNGWLLQSQPLDGGSNLELHPSFVARARHIIEARDPLIAALNLGVREGAKVLAKERTAYHEAGHAVVSYVLRPELTVSLVTIVSNGASDGCTYFDNSSAYWDRFRQEDLRANLKVALAGRMAEQIKFGKDQADTGARRDIEQATEMAWKAITTSGLDDEFGPVDLSILAKLTGHHAGLLFDRAQERLANILKDTELDTRHILEANWAQVEILARRLIREELVSSEQLIDALVLNSLLNVHGAVQAYSLPLERHVEFAKNDGVHETPEGPVRFRAGDAIIHDDDGTSWPVSRSRFDDLYEPSKGTRTGDAGIYLKRRKAVRALQIAAPRRLDLTKGRGQLKGLAGDWIVDYGNRDLAIVANEIFSKTYKIFVEN